MAIVAALGLAGMVCLLFLVAGPKWGANATWFRRAVIRARTLRGRLLIGLFLVGAMPVMTLPPILMLENARSRQAELGEQLRLDAAGLAHGLMRAVRKEVAGVDELAAHINAMNGITSLDELDPPVLVDWLLRHHTANPEFVSTWIARPDGEVVAATAFLEGDHKPWSGPLAGVSLLNFFPASVEHGGLYVTPVMKGVAPRYDPMIVISAPLFAGGTKPWGFLQSQLNVRRVFRQVVTFESTPGRFLVVTDRRGRVVAAFPEGGFRRFDDISGHPLFAGAELSDGQSFAFKGSVEGEEISGEYLASNRVMDSGWHVFALGSLSGMRQQALIFLALSLVWVSFVVYLAATLARFYGAIIGEPLRTLDQSLDVFDVEHTLKMVPMAPKDAPIEIAQVFNRVRSSLEKSRDSYRNMLKAINEGEELRRRLQLESKARTDLQAQSDDSARQNVRKRRSQSAHNTKKSANKVAAAAVPAEYIGRWDSATELSGSDVFNEFFGEAWALGCADARPLSVLFCSIGLERLREAGIDVHLDTEILKSTGKVLRRIAARELDLVARIEEDKYALVLPDTDLYGALVVAERARQALEVILISSPGAKELEVNVAVASVIPKPEGDAPAIVRVVHRLLAATQKKEGSRVAYMDESLKLNVLEVGESVPTGPRKAQKRQVRKLGGSAQPPAAASVTKGSVSAPPRAPRPASPTRPRPGSPADPGDADLMELELELEKTMTFLRKNSDAEPDHGLQPYAPAADPAPKKTPKAGPPTALRAPAARAPADPAIDLALEKTGHVKPTSNGLLDGVIADDDATIRAKHMVDEDS